MKRVDEDSEENVKRVMTRSGGALTREQFLLREMRIVARLRSEGASDAEILDCAETQNVFQYPTTRQARRLAGACLIRLENLNNPDLAELLAEGEGASEEAAQCNLYAMARTYRLMRVFLIDEIGVRYRTMDYRFSRMDMNAFFTRLAIEVPKVAEWSDGTVSKLKTVLRTSLSQAGMLADAKSEELVPIYLSPRVRDGIVANGDADLLPAFNCMDAYRIGKEARL